MRCNWTLFLKNTQPQNWGFSGDGKDWVKHPYIFQIKTHNCKQLNPFKIWWHWFTGFILTVKRHCTACFKRWSWLWEPTSWLEIFAEYLPRRECINHRSFKEMTPSSFWWSTSSMSGSLKCLYVARFVLELVSKRICDHLHYKDKYFSS